MRAPFPKLASQRGIGLIEAVIAIGIAGIIVVGIGTKMKLVRERINRVQASQALDALETNLRSLMTMDDHVRYSAEKTGGAVASCFRNGSCKNGGLYNINMYVLGQNEPLTGPNRAYDRNGAIAKGNAPKVFQIDTKIAVFCSPGGIAAPGSCESPRYYTIRYQIRNLARGGNLVREDWVETLTKPNLFLLNQTPRCPGGSSEVIRGLRMDGTPICTRLSSIRFPNTGVDKPGDFYVQRIDCRPEGKNTDDRVVIGIDDDGEVICEDKGW